MKKEFIFIRYSILLSFILLLSFTIISAFSFSDLWKVTGKVIEGCTDQDGGQNFNEQGTVMDKTNRSETDYCVSSSQLTEWYCREDGLAVYIYADCNCQNGACIENVSNKCSDGTSYGQCSSTKPKYCDNGNLINNCQICGCPSIQICESNGSCTLTSLGAICIDSSILGDANNDGKVTYEDYIMIFNIYAGSIQPPSNLCCVDLNKDGKVTREDSDLAYDVYVGKIDLGICSGISLPPSSNCTDNDGGDNKNVFGTTTGYKAFWDKIPENFVQQKDYCTSTWQGTLTPTNNPTNYLVEYYCDDNNYAAFKVRYCLSGCENGGCKESNIPLTGCTDSDEGFNYSIQGTTIGKYSGNPNASYTDRCSTSTQLTEWYCDEVVEQGIGTLKVFYKYYNCPNSCDNGACVENVSNKCSDGTSYGQCSSTKPKYCDNGNLINNCQVCGCPNSQICQDDGSCYSMRWTNPTAPNDLIKYLSGDFTDTDGDGMTDVAEIKYGFDPIDASSFPLEPEVIVLEQFPIGGSEIGAYYEINFDEMVIRWSNPSDGTYSLSLKTKGSNEWNIYYGGHYSEYAQIPFKKFNLNGTETLTGHFTKYALNRSFVEQYSEFEIDLSKIEFPKISEVIGNPSNKISYTFSDDFPADAETQYREFLKRVFPIMYKYLGPPAENFNTYIKNMGEDTGWFMIVDDGRTFLTDTEFIPRLITHEFVHAWKGNFIMASDENWEYDPKLSGFEEATAEGMAFEIIHEYVRSYPNDSATIQLLSWKPYQYWSSRTTFYDSIKHNRNTGAGEFWNPPTLQTNRYSISATTLQMMIRENPNFMKEFLVNYFKKIKEDPNWRPNRGDIVNMWKSLVPTLNDYPLEQYLNALPVFNGKKLEGGIYVLDEIRTYGLLGDQQFAVGYALPENDYSFNQDGMIWWGLYENELNTLPEWIKTSKGEDGFYYTDMQNSSFTVEVLDAYGNNYATYNFRTDYDRYPDGHPTGLGWFYAEELEMEKFPFGLYKEIITFTDYIDYDQGAKETFYFFGLKDFEQDREKDYVIMMGIEGVSEGTAEISINGQKYTAPINNGVAVFRSTEWRFDMQDKFPLTITNNEGVSKEYYRTIIESGTFHNYYQQQFIIVDKNFNGVEDEFE